MSGDPVDRFERLWSGDEAWDELDHHKIPLVARTLADLGTRVRTVLDVGCGDGRLLKALPDRLQRFGCDRSRSGVRRLVPRGVVASCTALPFPATSFDLLLCCDLLEHLDRAAHRQALDELQRVARSYVLITVPYREDLRASDARCPACGLVYNADTHVRRYGPGAVARLKRRFRGFALELEVPHGPVHRHYWSPVTRGHHLFGRYLRSERAVCPRCGSGTAPPEGRSRDPLYRAYCRATNALGGIWPFRHHHERMLLFRRDGR